MNPEPYRCMWNSRGENNLQLLIELREVIEEIPPRKATFKPTQYLNRPHFTKTHRYEDLVYLADAWLLPEWSPGSHSNCTRIVNPNGYHAESHPAIGVECGCGAIVTGFRTPDLDVHAETCTPEMREGPQRKLKSMRIRESIRGANFNKDVSSVAQRMSVSTSRLRDILFEYDITWRNIRRLGKMRMTETLKGLYRDGELMYDISRGFGISERSVGDYVNGMYENKAVV